MSTSGAAGAGGAGGSGVGAGAPTTASTPRIPLTMCVNVSLAQIVGKWTLMKVRSLLSHLLLWRGLRR